MPTPAARASRAYRFPSPPRFDPAAGALRIPRRTVVCPECAAEVGEVCTASTGKPLTGGHTSRRRLATRLYNDQRAAQIGATA